MAIFESKDGKELIVTCGCSAGFGCGEAFRITIEHDEEFGDYAFVTYMNNRWNAEMENKNIFRMIGRKLGKIWAIIFGDDYYYSDIRMCEEEFEEFKKFVNKW